MRSRIIAFSLGIGALQMQPALPDWPPLVVLLAAAGLLWLVRQRPTAGRVQSVGCLALSLAGCALLGFAWAVLRAEQRLDDRLEAAWESRDVQIVGVVAALPHVFERGERFEFTVERVDTPGARLPRRIMLSWYRGSLDDEWRDGLKIRPAERWRFTVRLKRPHGNANPYGFDYEAWLFERGLRATGYVRPQAIAERLDDLVPAPAYLIERLRDHFRQSFYEVLGDSPYTGILVALAVGDQQSIPGDQWRLFRQTGVTHLMSISGLHVTMVAALFASLAGWIWRRSERAMLYLPAPKAAVAAGWLAALAYSLLAGFAVPTQRTLYMLSVVALALWSGRNFGVSRSLLLALLLVLLIDPWAVLSPGFWLSFTAVGVLFFVGTPQIGAARGWRAMLASWGSTQWAVTIGTLPLLLLLFQQFSLVSPLANAVAIPLVSLLVAPIALIFVAIPWPPLLHLDHWLVSGLMAFLEWLAVWPIWEQPAPPDLATLLAVVGVIWLLLPRGFPARWLGLCMLLPALSWPAARPAPDEAWVDVLDVGQGLAVVVRTARHTLLYDTGPLYSAESDAGQRIIVPYLRAHGVRAIDTLLVTHRDKDHSGGTMAIEETLPVARRLSSVPELQPERCFAGQEWLWDGVHFAVLHPAAGDYERDAAKTNNMSCVLRIAIAAGSILLTSDIEARDEQALLARARPQLKSDVLLVPHHGSGTSSTPDFVAAVSAREAVIPVGYLNRFQHPRADVVERYATSRVWRTDRDGAVRIRLGAEGPALSSHRSEYRRYWHGQ
ncbi:DNA internalization-related competence protein ComEC/Rec2 [Accumulibacter sp.]|uniref:DNA internalization-related competence protein ComEC/Rec2 n=1 Tax=Accumulibacter sp. TaxID=2053492 RepID=UPI0025D56419|nr:DNA internalization-related competence protein ComEC/Rec2 [Accumulibacter sp.]MCM8627728.1 DNA internalization-related competence protein ComEC/Rec2 [Accumulibacter sp.]